MKRLTIPIALLALMAAPAAFAGTISKATVERVSADKVIVRWSDSDPVDVFQSDRPDATVAEAAPVSAKDGDGSYEAASASRSGRLFFLLRDSRTGNLLRVAERVLPLDQGSNFRDIGGYATRDGRHVRWGMIYRTGGQAMLTDLDVKRLQSLRIANLVDLQSDEERILAPTRLDGIAYNAVGYSIGRMMSPAPGGGYVMPDMAAIYRTFPTLLAPQIRIVFRKLLSGEGALAYNCSAGQDRTGFMTALILSALGVPRETIYADYALSTASRRPRWELPPISEAMAANSPVAAMLAKAQADPAASKPEPLVTADGDPLLSQALAEIDARWGSVDTYLEREIGLGKQDIAALRAAYLE
ncbi:MULTISPECIES: tyrosine-protein phosphatase [unclassified Sphingomonas]|uniref:tyrosine-protein phosphatase n=1 Tax=unclassified Sphingomonas TaxID=196159 RepID=UPI0009277B66|nr:MULTISPECIES: tyrosine-protein phosphatase [unclassified Sphingomonas]MBN8849877.1 tyrosine-protein phosphatase [Sphingomonas sp.]OJV31745.1 MAG: protein tyrosine phosphatase [Sphingomonas sp. 67-36]